MRGRGAEEVGRRREGKKEERGGGVRGERAQSQRRSGGEDARAVRPVSDSEARVGRALLLLLILNDY
eukprot:3497739-Heterocapsa_arctica.AAC.1